MCGIWLEVLAASYSEHKTEFEETKNLARRGPDHVGSVRCDHQGHEIRLLASVLKMRSHSTLQPVPLQQDAMHLAWNGEVYQTLNIDDDKNSVETVAGYEVADTQLVADRLLEAYNNNNNYKQPQEFATAIANDVMGSLVNAEYSFCLVTPFAIYYGRDPWGRRSLLYWDNNDNNDTVGKAGETTERDHPAVWKLRSVTEDSNFDNQGKSKSQIWREVAPGIVHEYRFETGRFHATPIPTAAWEHPQLTLTITPNLPENTTPSMWKASFALEHWLRQAVQLRVCGNTDPQAKDSAPLPIAVLFSGGIDSVVLAALALHVLPTNEPLKLWNVSFVDQHTGAPTTAQDCLAAQASYAELQELFPSRTVLLETTEVSWEEMTKCENHVRNLLHPKSTTMDLNIAMALWFASRGKDDNGIVDVDGIATQSSTDPRILLVGMGADEQLGGYGRHRKAFQRAMEDSQEAENANGCLRQELDLDIGRLWERNLGRDDRIFSDHGKEARFPYLDYHVTNFLAQTPLEDICDYSLPPGQGDKRILRLLAMRLGLKTASGMVKRAIQFGSRISHVSDKRRFGSRRKAKGTATL